MKIQSLNTHSPVMFDGKLTNFLHPNEFSFVFREHWVIVTSKRSGQVLAIPAANIPYMTVDLETPKTKKGE